jgi:hypothetical protein
MTDWIEHRGDTCPVDPETVVEVVLRGTGTAEPRAAKGRDWFWHSKAPFAITHYRIITPAKPPEPEMETVSKAIELHQPPLRVQPEPDLITLRLECLKLAVAAHPTVKWNRNKPTPSLDHLADIFLRYAIDGSVAAR